MSDRRFPPDFLWGAATAAHQVEGGNFNSDCWALELAEPSLFAEPSGDAADHYHRFAEDLDIVASLGLNAYRFSIEWARIEPERGEICAAAADFSHTFCGFAPHRGVRRGRGELLQRFFRQCDSAETRRSAHQCEPAQLGNLLVANGSGE